MITWRGWGLLVILTGGVPVVVAVPIALSAMPDAPGTAQGPQSITGYFAVALLASAALTYGLHRLLDRWRGDRPHDLMGLSVKNWTYLYLVFALMACAAWAMGN